MKHSRRKRRRNSNLRPYGTISATNSTANRALGSSNYNSSTRHNLTLSDRSTPVITSGYFTAIAKGSSIFLLIAIIFQLKAMPAFDFSPLPTAAHRSSPDASPSLASLTTAADYQASARTSESLTNKGKTHESKGEGSENAIIEIMASARNSSGNAKENHPALVVEQLNHEKGNASAQPGLPDTTRAIEHVPESREIPQDIPVDIPRDIPLNTAPQTVSAYFINAYKATIFSSLSSNAKETHVPHGTAVKILVTYDNWVKVEVPNQQLSGFVHVSQLSAR